MNRKFILRNWYASVYEQFENQTNDVDFFIEILRELPDKLPKNILEAACGGGRISIPLATAGHNVTGFDIDEFMLMRCYRRMKGLLNIHCYQADAINASWGENFDVVLMGGNLLINIETDGDYKEAQQIFICKAASALREGGYLILDYDQHCPQSAIKFFNNADERTAFSGEDEMGTSGRFMNYGGTYDPVTQICTWASHLEVLTNNGQNIVKSTAGHKHIPMLNQVYEWLDKAGFDIEKTYRNYTREPLSENEKEHVRATVLARKK